jgi:hypothetical protein
LPSFFIPSIQTSPLPSLPHLFLLDHSFFGVLFPFSFISLPHPHFPFLFSFFARRPTTSISSVTSTPHPFLLFRQQYFLTFFLLSSFTSDFAPFFHVHFLLPCSILSQLSTTIY